MLSIKERIASYFDEKTLGPDIVFRNKSIATILGVGFAAIACKFVLSSFLKQRRIAVEEQAAKKRKCSVNIKLTLKTHQHLQTAQDQFTLPDTSKALRAILDFLMQEHVAEDLFKADKASTLSSLEQQQSEEKFYTLDVTHIDWLETHVKKYDFPDSGALLEYLIEHHVLQVDGAVVYGIDRSQSRARTAGVRFSIRS